MEGYLDSLEDPDVAFKLSQELVALLALGGCKLTKFVKNVPQVDRNFNLHEGAQQRGSINLYILKLTFHMFLVFDRKLWCQP